MKVLFSFILFFCSPILLWAQQGDAYPYGFGCEGGFYKVYQNQLHLLSTNKSGEWNWYPVMQAFERPVAVISFHSEDEFLYAFDTLTFELLRIYKTGGIQSLGCPIHEATKAPLDQKFRVGEIAQGIFCAYAPGDGQLYWVDIKKGTFVTTPPLVDSEIVNMAYHPIDEKLYTLCADSKLYAFDPQRQYLFKRPLIKELPSGPFNSQGNLWITQDGRLFVSRRHGEQFFEINEETQIPYRTKQPIVGMLGDGTSCPNALAPVFNDEEIFELRLDAPNRGQSMLRWTGIYEYNNNHYIVEKSLDNVIWEQKDLKPASKMGLYQNPYGSLRRVEEEETSYFRLKKMYNSGKAIYSRTLMLYLDEGLPTIILSPNVAFGNRNLALYISGYEGHVLEFVIENAQGKVVKRFQQELLSLELTLSVSIEGLATGNYVLKTISSTGVERQRFWVQGQ